MNEKMYDTLREAKEGTAYVYLLLCADGSYYCGYTTDPMRRLETHNAGKGAKYTRSRRPWTLVYAERCDSKSAALQRECALKRLRHEEKAALAACWSAEQREGFYDGAGDIV